MNKQELIERIKGLENIFGNKTKYIQKDAVIRFISELDEPQKPVIPKFVADWICYLKGWNYGLCYGLSNASDEVLEWLCVDKLKRQELFARAWLDGYEVEKEKRYLVKMKGMASNFRFLKYNLSTKNCYMGNDSEIQHARLYHTRKELEETGFGEVFDSQLFEVEEVGE